MTFLLMFAESGVWTPKSPNHNQGAQSKVFFTPPHPWSKTRPSVVFDLAESGKEALAEVHSHPAGRSDRLRQVSNAVSVG